MDTERKNQKLKDWNAAFSEPGSSILSLQFLEILSGFIFTFYFLLSWTTFSYHYLKCTLKKGPTEWESCDEKKKNTRPEKRRKKLWMRSHLYVVWFWR